MDATPHSQTPGRGGLAPHAAPRRVPVTTQGVPARIGQRVLLIGDAENLSYGLRKEGFDLDFARLRELVAACSGTIHPHAFATVSGAAAQRYAQDYFTRIGWEHRVECAHTVRTCRGTERRANSDPCILLGCGELATRLQPDAVVLATGDGDLGCDMARYLKRRPGSTRVLVCSIAMATSHRLLAANNPDIDGNLWLGWDCMVRAQ